MKKMLSSKAFLAFVIGFVMFIIVVLPELIENGGILIFDSDNRTQGIPFTYHIRNSILSGNVVWDHSAGLGSQFLTNYAYYNLFSPFSLLYLVIPEGAIIYALPYVTALKFGVGSMLAYLYIKRFVKNEHFAVIGGLLYMFSSFTAYNQVFHFTDIIALFPILLIALEELCVNRRKGFFALSCALMAYVNYYFFFGQALFVAIYFFVRGVDKQFAISFKKLGNVILEAMIGVMMAMPVILPLAVSLVENEKATTLLTAENMLLYKDIFYYLKIVQSAFMVPDSMQMISLFPASENIYPFGMLAGSVAAYLPLFSLAGVIAYVMAHKKSWETLFFAVCTVIAFVPVLNQSFSAFNSNYYARWYYMPMLIAAMVSLKAIEERVSFKGGIITCSGALCAMVIYQLVVDTEELIPMHAPRGMMNTPLTYINFAVTAIAIVCLVLLCASKRDKEFVPKMYIFSAVNIYMCFGIMSFMLLTYIDVEEYIPLYCFNYVPSAEYSDDTDRISIQSTDTNNFNQIWKKDGIDYFNSTYDPGFYRFLVENGCKYDAGIFADIDYKKSELAGAVGVKYFYMIDDDRIQGGKKADDFGVYTVIENPYYIPMGYTYDYMISYEDFSAIEDLETKHRVYAQYLIADNPEQFEDVLELYSGDTALSEDEYLNAVSERCKQTVTEARKTADGYIAKSNFDKNELVFLATSYNNGWNAFVNGEQTEVYEVNNGLVGIKVPSGECEIVLKYTIRGLTEGLVGGGVGIAALVGYLLVSKRLKESNRACV